MPGPTGNDPNAIQDPNKVVNPNAGKPAEETLIFGKYKTQEEAEAAYKELERKQTEQSETITGLEGRVEELGKPAKPTIPATGKPVVGADGEPIFSDEEAGLFDPAILGAIRKLIGIETGKSEKVLMGTIRQQNLIDKASSEAEDWIIDNFSNEADPEMDIRNEKGKLFQLSQKIWKTAYGNNLLFQKHAVLEANHQLGGQGKVTTTEKEPEAEVVGSFAPGANYQVGAKGKEMPWEEFVKLPQWRRDEVLAEEAQAKVGGSFLNR